MNDHDVDGIVGTRPRRDQTAGLGLFDPPSVESSAASAPAPTPRAIEETQAFAAAGVLTERELRDNIARIQREVQQPLCDLARLRRDREQEPGVTAEDARAIADTRGLGTLLGKEQRAWSWLSAWLGRLDREGVLTKYRLGDMVVKRMGSNGNEQVIYLDPYDTRAHRAVVAA